MFGNQRLECDVCKNISAVNDECVLPKNAFHIFDPAACFEQILLVNERSVKASVVALGKEILEQFRMPMRVYDESVYSHAYQMIERESNERLLKDRDERLRQLLGQWTQARAKTRCQNECLSDFVHEQKIERFLPPTLKLRRARRLYSQWIQTGRRTLPISDKASACRSR